MPTARLAALFLLATTAAVAQWPPASWTKPLPRIQIVDNVYYVGTYDLAAYLITTPDGHFLINTGLEDSTSLIRDNIAKAGHKLEDVKILLTMQAHYDHCAALAEIKQITGAKLFATEGDKPVLEDGGRSDYHLGEQGHFPPVQVDRVIDHGESLTLGDVTLKVHVHPGHTKGSVSYALEATGNGKSYDVLLANMGSVNPGVKLRDNPKYPEITRDYLLAFERQKQLAPDIWLAAHASQCRLHKKWQAGQAYSPEAFVDGQGYKAAVARHERMFLEALSEQTTVDAE